MDLTEIEGMAWSDLELESVTWDEGGRDVVVCVRLPGIEPRLPRRRVISCRWAEGLTLKLAFAQAEGGYPLTWATTFTRLSDGRYSILFDFGNSGEIRLACTDLEVTSLS